ncbi:MAG: nuclear transport factor 2 family protein [Rhodospirillaceae bacterium]|nr:nuclear transport factor 2 family protein [Rhodospirillaceae bacterium]
MTPEAERLQTLWDRGEIERVMLDFGKALDRGDWHLYRACLADRIRIDFERLTGFAEVEVNADEWVRFASLALGPVKRHHQYSNFSCVINGDHADTTMYMVARHWKATDRGGATNTQYGWYENLFQRIEGTWKISRISHQFQWIDGNDALLDFSEPELAAQMRVVFSPANLIKPLTPAVAP